MLGNIQILYCHQDFRLYIVLDLGYLDVTNVLFCLVLKAAQSKAVSFSEHTDCSTCFNATMSLHTSIFTLIII